MPDEFSTFSLYRVFYGERLVYIGRTKQLLPDRIRNHVFAPEGKRVLDVNKITKIEFASVETEADMTLYETYYILKEKPPLNTDDTAPDDLTVDLPELVWKPAIFPLWEEWKFKFNQRQLLCTL